MYGFIWRPEKGVSFLELELQVVVSASIWELNSSPLQELLTTEPSLALEFFLKTEIIQ